MQAKASVFMGTAQLLGSDLGLGVPSGSQGEPVRQVDPESDLGRISFAVAEKPRVQRRAISRLHSTHRRTSIQP